MTIPEFLISGFNVTTPEGGTISRSVCVQTKAPYLIAQIVFVRQDDTAAVEDFNLQAANGRCAKVPGYSVYLYPIQCEGRVPEADTLGILRSMTTAVSDTVLKPKRGKYRWYMENYQSTSPSQEYSRTMAARGKEYRAQARRLRHRIMTGQEDGRIKSLSGGDEGEE